MNGIKGMMSSRFLRIVCLCILVTVQPTRSKNYCEEREKSLLSLNIAEDLITRAKHLFPNCTDTITNTSECGAKEKANALLDMSKKLIMDSKKYYPTCTNPETEEPETTQSIITTPITTQRTTTQHTLTTKPTTTQPTTTQPTTTQPTTTELTTTQPTTTQPLVYYKDCSELADNGQNVSGVYTIWPNSSLFLNRSLEVFCDMVTDGGGWTVFQRRGDFTPRESFFRTWEEYKNGFGNITRDFWLGNDNLFVLSNQGKYKIRFDLEAVDGDKAYAEYDSFYVKDERARYTMHITGYSGTAGNLMQRNNGAMFSTKDRYHDVSPSSCYNIRRGGWWYKECTNPNPNGDYNPGSKENYPHNMSWNPWKSGAGLAATEFKVKAVKN